MKGYIKLVSALVMVVAFAAVASAADPVISNPTPSSPVGGTEGGSQTFTFDIDQSANVTWYINGTIVKDSEKGVTDASYTNTSAEVGYWNVSAVANNANGSDM
ncbi:MAG: hypothetical protein KAS74_01775, partial [Methanosarcinales archaeon]|nr:hypothetical protein [Methanosarcinales archaeon]